MAFVLAGCGASAQQKALHATYLGVKAAEAGFVEWDAHHQDEIVAKAKSLTDGAAALQRYRLKRDPVLQAFIAVYQLLYVAASDTTQERLDAAIGAAQRLYNLIETLRAPTPEHEARRQLGGARMARVQRRPTPVITLSRSVPAYPFLGSWPARVCHIGEIGR